MNNEEKFEEIYSKIMAENVQSLEEAKYEAKKELKKHRIILMIFACIGVLLYVATYKYKELVTVTMLSYLFLVCFISVKLVSNKKRKLFSECTDELKIKMVKALIASFNENIEYFPSENIASNVYDEAEFEEYDRYYSKDLIKGTLKNNCNFLMSRFSTYMKYENREGIIEYETIFEGMFAKIEIPKPFNARLYLRDDYKDQSMINRLFAEKLSFDDLKVDLDSREFEKCFDVYCSDKIIAMQLLTADIMQLLVEYQKKMQYELTIKNNCIYLRFMTGKIFEETSLEKFSIEKEKNILYKYYEILNFSFLLTNMLVDVIKNSDI